ncbi:MAG: DUF998 domain-containing protein [Thaumarchaeota archaeon]|nr:DUF998 domain-containing protein [Nitrososphaerota archaeon]
MKRPVEAFPNAYLEVDEPPNKALRNKALAFIAAGGIGFFALVIFVLHFEPTGYNPLTQAVSDYAVGSFAWEMQLGFYIGGIGLATLGVLNYLSAKARSSKVGSALLFLAGIALFTVGAFPTDLEGTPATLHGIMHSVISQVVFSAGPIGMVLISYAVGRRPFLATLVAWLTAGGFFALVTALSLGASGLAERLFIAVLVVWWFADSVYLSKSA